MHKDILIATLNEIIQELKTHETPFLNSQKGNLKFRKFVNAEIDNENMHSILITIDF